MTVTSTLHTLSTTAQLIATGRHSGANDKSGVLITEGSANIYIGGPAVDATDGVLVEAGTALALDLSTGDMLYAIATSGTPTVKVLTTRTGYVAAS